MRLLGAKETPVGIVWKNRSLGIASYMKSIIELQELQDILRTADCACFTWLENEYQEAIGRTVDGKRFVYDAILPRRNLIRDASARSCSSQIRIKLEEIERELELAKKQCGGECGKP